MNGRNAGPFFKNGVDLYENDKGIRWFINIFRFLFVVGIFIYISVFIHNLRFKHTYFENPGNPGVLTSDRYSFNWVITMLTVIINVSLITFIFFMVIFRNNFGCGITWFILYILFFALLVFIIIAYGLQYSHCNGPNEVDNMCNDPKWCCVHFTNPLNQCPNTIPCAPPITQSDLSPNQDFLALFWTLVVLGALYFIFILIILFYWFSDEPVKIVDEQEQEQEQEISSVILPMTSKKKSHGLRKRK